MEEVDGNLGFMIYVPGLDASMQSGLCLYIWWFCICGRVSSEFFCSPYLLFLSLFDCNFI